ncbi:hypothetical protein B0H19DRAFT_419069 [Mycena capillaripes]|nr:hypothetical protein B0H19DRAFT_419069 [Mycena capillaripes]
MDVLIGQLKAKRAVLKTDIDAHKALVSPMQSIPEDILREIFVACLPTAHNALIDPDEAPMLFSRICRQWRGVADSTPRIWCTLHIPETTDYAPQAQNRLCQKQAREMRTGMARTFWRLPSVDFLFTLLISESNRLFVCGLADPFSCGPADQSCTPYTTPPSWLSHR